MSIKNAIGIAVGYSGDNISTILRIDLEKDPYAFQFPGINWDRKVAPIAAQSTQPSISASLLGSVLTLTFSTPPTEMANVLVVYILFPGE